MFPKIIHDYIYQCIPLFFSKMIKKLNVKNYNQDDFTFTTYRLSSLDLTKLRLNRVYLSSTLWFRSFTRLTIDFKSSMFDCPVPEKLTLLYCEGLFPNNFCAPNLKCLNEACGELPLEYSLAGLKSQRIFSMHRQKHLMRSTFSTVYIKL